jgi:hypothetical protein
MRLCLGSMHSKGVMFPALSRLAMPLMSARMLTRHAHMLRTLQVGVPRRATLATKVVRVRVCALNIGGAHVRAIFIQVRVLYVPALCTLVGC